MKDLLKDNTDDELLQSVIAEAAKASNELNCAKSDLKKATNRMNFILMLANTLIDRKGD